MPFGRGRALNEDSLRASSFAAAISSSSLNFFRASLFVALISFGRQVKERMNSVALAPGVGGLGGGDATTVPRAQHSIVGRQVRHYLHPDGKYR